MFQVRFRASMLQALGARRMIGRQVTTTLVTHPWRKEREAPRPIAFTRSSREAVAPFCSCNHPSPEFHHHG